jgi:5-methylcytosine-specific restriction endonuclease McrA
MHFPNNMVVVLNHDYSFLNIVSPQTAFRYIAKGKVVIEKFAKKVLTTAEKVYKIPLVIRFTYLIRQVYKRKVPWSKKNIWIRDGYVCGYCGKHESFMTVDHVVPKSKGGKSTFENTVTACKKCNSKKADMLPKECGMYPKHSLVQPTITEFMRKWHKHLRIDEIMKQIWEVDYE